MNEQENTKLVAKTYELFTSGDIETLLGMYSDDVSWETPKVENMPFGGKVSGRDKVAEFFTILDEHEEFSVFEPTEFIAQGDKVVVLGNFAWRIKSTNKEYASDFAHIVTVADGKITGFYEFFDNAAAGRAYTAANAA
ncbi:MAG TPA: nuclear transport factor 2 family protein [Pyrinomonadaceae bacterium]|jgi:ketosteroid isomerase-like protein|nr:nuclear transport factor 2 family protein [Pyrinomonadaceae bacterium]